MQARKRFIVITAVAAIALFSGCSDAARDAAHSADRVRTGSAGRLADRACAKVADAIPGARKAVDAARHAVLRGDADTAKKVIDQIVGLYIDHVTFDIGLSLKACRVALG